MSKYRNKYSETFSTDSISSLNTSRRSGSVKRRRTNLMRRKKRRIEEHFLNKIKGFAESALSAPKRAIESSVKGITSAVQGTINTVKSGITNSINSAKSAVSSTVNTVKSGITSSVDSIKNKVKSSVDSVKRKAKSSIDSIKSGISSSVNTVKSGIMKAGDKLKKIPNALKKKFKEVGGKIKKSVSSIGNKVKEIGKKIGRTAKSVMKKVSDGVWKAFKWIGKMSQKVFGKVKKFFSKIWNFIKKILFSVVKKLWWPFANARKFIKWLITGIIQFALAVVLGPLGQLIVRNAFLNGSYDKPWLFYLPIFPFTLIGGWYFLIGAVKKGVGPIVMDKNGIILSLISGLIPWLVSFIFPINNSFFAVTYALCLYVYYIFMFYFRDRDRCGGDGFKLGKLLRSANSMGSIAAVTMPALFVTILSIFYLNAKIHTIGVLRFGLLFNTIYTLTGYLITNMKNNTKSVNNYCKPHPVKNAAMGAIMTIALMIGWNIIEVMMTNLFCPGLGDCRISLSLGGVDIEVEGSGDVSVDM